MGRPLIGVRQAAALARVPLTDYDRPSSGLLVSSGAGIMMAVMDAAPALRWCVDIDGLPARADLEFFLRLADGDAEPLAVCGWFSITDPTTLRRALGALRARALVYAGNVRLGVKGEMDSLGALVAALARLESVPEQAPAVAVQRKNW